MSGRRVWSAPVRFAVLFVILAVAGMVLWAVTRWL